MQSTTRWILLLSQHHRYAHNGCQQISSRSYLASSFTRCTRQPLPQMQGEPMPIITDPDVKPTAVHTPIPVPRRSSRTWTETWPLGSSSPCLSTQTQSGVLYDNSTKIEPTALNNASHQIPVHVGV